jgi:hypothetical protein
MTDYPQFHIGDRIEHKLMPGFAMTVKAIDACRPDPTRPAQHSQYKITDPEGNEDWLCAYDVRAAP